jgi:hypothetical protein
MLAPQPANMKLRAKMMSLDIITSFPFWSSSCRPTWPCR